MRAWTAMRTKVCPPARTPVVDAGLATVRLAAGGLLAGHGAQKLFGTFGGPGLERTGSWLESLGLKPGMRWAALAGLSEFAGGVLTGLGLMHPLGPIALQGAMMTAIRQVHWGKPIWVTEGGAELPVIYSTIGLGLAFAGPGRYSLDHALGIHIPKPVTALAAAAVATGIVVANRRHPPATEHERRPSEAEATQETAEDRLVSATPERSATSVRKEQSGDKIMPPFPIQPAAPGDESALA